jgi:CTP:phosphocholine cytidylyltransferase-like protein
MQKSMVPIAGKPMLLRSLAHFRSVGVTEFIIVRGYKASYFDSVDLGPVLFDIYKNTLLFIIWSCKLDSLN